MSVIPEVSFENFQPTGETGPLGVEYRADLDAPVFIEQTDTFAGLLAKVKLPEVADRRRRLRAFFRPETRTGLGNTPWQLTHGITTTLRKNADGLWLLKLVADCDPATGDVTITGLTATFNDKP